VKKLRIGFLNITGCVGCMLSVLFNEQELVELSKAVEITAFPFIRKKAAATYDIVLLEGLVANREDLDFLRDIRKRTVMLVALGSCAATGCIPAIRNFIDRRSYVHLMYDKIEKISDLDPKPVTDYVDVDYVIPGCPPDKKEIMAFLKDVSAGKRPSPCTDPVCVECRLNGNFCLIERGKLCLGPVTAGGCNAVCINGGFECWGCRGSHEDANQKAFMELMESKGYDRKTVVERMRTFNGLKLRGEEK